MIDGLDRLRAAYAAGRMDRRAFLRNAAALGLTASAAASLADAARAATRRKGGTLRMGLGGGESTNSLDPALALSQAPFHLLRAFGEPLPNVNGDGALDMRVASAPRSASIMPTSGPARYWPKSRTRIRERGQVAMGGSARCERSVARR
jgi:peptide/nickel transport system substrate-binding protein